MMLSLSSFTPVSITAPSRSKVSGDSPTRVGSGKQDVLHQVLEGCFSEEFWVPGIVSVSRMMPGYIEF
jgi:hypothetical protein